jgi:hypothetical protein
MHRYRNSKEHGAVFEIHFYHSDSNTDLKRSYNVNNTQTNDNFI